VQHGFYEGQVLECDHLRNRNKISVMTVPLHY
jgi:hypothetical protein